MRQHVWVFFYDSGRGWMIEIYDYKQPFVEAVFQLIAEGLNLKFHDNWEAIEADPRYYDLRTAIQKKDVVTAIEEWNDLADEHIIYGRIPVDLHPPFKVKNRIAENMCNPQEAIELLKQLREKT